MAAVDNKLAILAEIDRLIQSAPPKETFYHDLPEHHAWLGEVSNAVGLWNPVKAAGLTVTIGNVYDRAIRGQNARQVILVTLMEARRSLQMAQGFGAAAHLKPSEQQRSEAKAELQTLRQVVTDSNSIDPENREVLLAEIAAFEATIVQPRVSADLIYRFVNGVLRGTAMKLVGATGDEVASRIAIALLAWVAAHAGK